jgi:hypothetical protein
MRALGRLAGADQRPAASCDVTAPAGLAGNHTRIPDMFFWAGFAGTAGTLSSSTSKAGGGAISPAAEVTPRSV